MPKRPIELSHLQRQEVETLAALLNQEQIADYLGISRRTFQAILDRDDEAAARYKRGKAKAIAHVASGLLQKARSGCTTSSIFYLKTQAGWRETERLEHVAAQPGPADLRDTARRLHAFFERVADHRRREPHPGIGGGFESGVIDPAIDAVAVAPREEE